MCILIFFYNFSIIIFTGCIAFFFMTLYFASRPEEELSFQDKLVFIIYFIGAITCMGFSFVFHTVHCHSETVGKLFSK